MNLRRPFICSVAIVAIFFAFAPIAWARAPFDCSARVIVPADSAEIPVTVGMTPDETFFAAHASRPAS